MAKAKSNTKKNAWQEDFEYKKRKMVKSRLIGILCCLLVLTCVVIYSLNATKVIDEILLSPWMCIIAISYCLGTIFSANSFLQNIKVGNPWQRINALFSVLFYVLVAFLIVYGFITKELKLQF